jgi:hypothetical protein
VSKCTLEEASGGAGVGSVGEVGMEAIIEIYGAVVEVVDEEAPEVTLLLVYVPLTVLTV